MKLCRFIVAALFLLSAAIPLRGQYRDDQFKRDAFTQTYADTTEKTAADTSSLFSFKEFFGGLAHKRTPSLRTLMMGSAVFVGSSQIYERQYWKLPLVYGGIGAGVYGGIHFNRMYQESGEEKYKTARTLSIAAAGLTYWASLMDGVVLYDQGGKYPNPAKSTAYSLLLPGLGQIYNGEAWKVPIYWGMMAGGVHFYLDNKLQYERWKWIHNQATTTDEVEERPPQSGETAKYYRDVFRRYRDYSMLFIALSYILQAVDANVFAYMHGFEVNDDISLRVEPALIPYNQYAALPPAVGLSFGIRF